MNHGISSALATSVMIDNAASQPSHFSCAPSQSPIALTASPDPSRLHSRHRVDDEIDGEFCVVLRAETFVLPGVVPLAPVILVRVHDAKPAPTLDAAQVAVDDVV